MRRKYTVFEAPVNRSQLEMWPLPSSIASVKTIMIAGLGNPGPEYDETRHNVGFMALDAIAHSFKVRRFNPVSYTHLRAHETRHDLVCRLLLEKKKTKISKKCRINKSDNRKDKPTENLLIQ